LQPRHSVGPLFGGGIKPLWSRRNIAQSGRLIAALRNGRHNRADLCRIAAHGEGIPGHAQLCAPRSIVQSREALPF